MYGSMFGGGGGGGNTPHGGCSSTHHQEPAASNSAYVEASSPPSSLAAAVGIGNNKSLNTQISLPPFHHSSTRSSGGGSDVGTALLSPPNDQPEQSVQQDGGATITSCVINLANTIIGAGMLGLPGALGGTGFVGGTILMVLGAMFSAHGLNLLSKAAQVSGSVPHSSFYSVAKASVPHYTILIDLAVALKCFGVATGYLITVGDCMVDALDHIIMTKPTLEEESKLVQTILSRQFWVVGATLAVLPVSFYRTLDELKKASALALVFVVMLVFGIVAYANQWGNMDPCGDDVDADECVGDMESFTNLQRTLAKLPIFVFAFTCHQNIFPIVNEIQQPQPADNNLQPTSSKALASTTLGQQQSQQSQRKINTIIGLSIGLAFGVFLLVALEGYKTFGSNVRGDILLNYPETTMVTVLRMCIAFMLTLHYPLQLDPSRRCITSLLQVIHQSWIWQRFLNIITTTRTSNNRAYHRRNSDLPEQGEESDAEEATEQSTFGKDHSNTTPSEYATNPSPLLFYTITIGFLFASFAIAMIVDDLGIILAMVGATGSTLVSYILPGLIYIKIINKKNRHHQSDQTMTTDWSMMGAYIQLIVGCLIMPIALYFVLLGSARE